VESVGLVSKDLPFCRTNNAIAHFRHALALDERRVKFTPSFYKSGKPKHDHTNPEGQQANPMDQGTNPTILMTNPGRESDHGRSDKLEPETDVEEVFFAGAHCGTILFSPLQSVRYLRMLFQMSGADL
jgi:uncharacterized protein (DUF2235 family)